MTKQPRKIAGQFMFAPPDERLGESIDEARHRDHFAEQHQAAPRLGVQRRRDRARRRAPGRARTASRRRCSQRSSAVSTDATSDVSSVWNPGGSLTRYPGCTLKKRASSCRDSCDRWRPRALFDERQIRLADRLAKLRRDGADELGLGELAAEPAELPFELPQLPKLLAQRHCNL